MRYADRRRWTPSRKASIRIPGAVLFTDLPTSLSLGQALLRTAVIPHLRIEEDGLDPQSCQFLPELSSLYLGDEASPLRTIK